MKDLNEIISEYMANRGVKDEHFITPQGWKEIAVLFAKEASKEQRVICSEEATITPKWRLIIENVEKEQLPKFLIDKESILNAKSPV